MSLDSIVTSLVKTSLNGLIKKNADSQRRLYRLQNKKLSIIFTDINKKLIFIFNKEIDVLADFKDKVDCSLATAISLAPQLKDKTQLASLIKEDKLAIDGDIDVLQNFVALLEELNLDITEWLSHYTGDVIAHTLVSSAKSVFSQINTLANKQQRYLSEVIIEEWKCIPSALEIAYFSDSVENVEKKVSQLESRLNAFETALNNKTK